MTRAEWNDAFTRRGQELDDRLSGTDWAEFEFDLLGEQEEDIASILMVGHNPGLEDLIFDLVPDAPGDSLRDMVEEKFPTAAYAVLELDIDAWANAAPGCGRLIHLIRPRDLDADLGPEPET